MNNDIIIILIIFFILIIRKNKEHWGSVGHWISHTASSAYHGVAHAATDTAQFIGDNTMKGICYMPGVKQMSNELLKRTAESRWNNRLKIIPCDKKDEMVNDAAEVGTWIAPGQAGHAAHAAHVAYEQQIKKCHMLKGNCKRGPRQGPYPNNQSAQLIHQNYTCDWNEETERCNCCSSLNCPNGWTKLNNKQCYKNGSNPGKNNTNNCPKEFPYKTNVTRYGNNGLCYNNKNFANQGWGAPHSWCAFKPATGQIRSEIRKGEGVYCESKNSNRCSLGDDTTYTKCIGGSNNCKNVNNYMLGYEVVRPPSDHARMC